MKRLFLNIYDTIETMSKICNNMTEFLNSHCNHSIFMVVVKCEKNLHFYRRCRRHWRKLRPAKKSKKI